MKLLFGCMSVHLVLTGMIPMGWWVPDLTLAGLVLGVVRAPRQWLPLAAAAGCWMALWAVRHPAAICLGYVAVGAAVRLLAEQWDLSDPRVPSVLTVCASLLLTCGMLWIDGLWSLPLIGFAAAHILLTGVSVCVVGHGLIARR